MYCINCGVKLSDTEKQCPLCGTVPFHPEISRPEAEGLYPGDRYPAYQLSPKGVLIVLTTLCLLPILITTLCDLRITGTISWSGYVIGAIIIGYIALVLPFWFKKPNAVVFVPSVFAAVCLYLLHINFETGGNWFLTLALPITAFFGIIVTAVVALMKYVPSGSLYIFGGAFIAVGAFMPVIEWLIHLTFNLPNYLVWSIYPFIALAVLGGMLIFLAIYRPAREAMERKFFI